MNSVRLCAGSYNVSAVQFGIDVTVSGPSDGSYDIVVNASSENTGIKPLTYNHNESNSVAHIHHLKPFTEYTITVYMRSDSKTACESKDKTVWTTEMGEFQR